MPGSVPHLSLSHGQVLWCLAGGKKPSPLLANQVRYLRQLGIPFEDSELGRGRGVRLSYGFYQLLEVGIAHEGIRRRIQPRFLTMLVEDRAKYRRVYRDTYLDLAQKPAVFEGNPRSRVVFGDEVFIRLHDRYSDTPGEITLVIQPPSSSGDRPGDLVESYEGEEDRVVIGLKTLIVRLLSLAKIAPVTRPGPKG